MIDTSTAYLGKTIEYNTLKTGLTNLNSNVRFDERNDDHIYAQSWEPRTGIWFRNDHICNVERIGATPQFNIYGLPKEDLFPIGVEECLMDDRMDENGPLSYFMTIVVKVDRDPQKFFALNKMIGNQMEMVAKRNDFTGGELLIERTAPGEIAVFTALGRRVCSTKVLRIGWIHIFKALEARRIPNMTRENLCRTFGVTYTPDDREDEQLIQEIRDITKR
jgi:hypothetical protein